MLRVLRHGFFALLILGLTGCAPVLTTPSATPAALRVIRLPMGYIPSVQFANFYLAVDQGYFAQEGLQIDFDYKFETDGVQLVAANQLPLAVVSGEQVLLARAQGLPVVYIMAWFQKFPVAIISKTEAGIKTAADLKGKKIGVPALSGASFIGLRALLAEAGLKAEDVTLQVTGYNQAAALTANQVDAVVVYSNNEPIRLTAQGLSLNVIQVSDSVDLAANGLMTNETVLAQDPALLRGFVRALVRGTQAALADPDKAFTISQKYVEGLKDPAVEKQVLAATLALWKTEHLGFASAKAWGNMQSTLLATQLLAQPLDLTKAYTNAFVP